MPVLGDFEGNWSVTRVIEQAGGNGQFEGNAHFVAEPGGLRLHEQGLLSLNNQHYRAERVYRWHAGGAAGGLAGGEVAPGGIAVFFQDGRFFHAFDPADPTPRAHHDCAPDSYDVRYDFTEWPCWTAVWRVTGPRKDYLMTSHYRRVPG